MKKIIISLAALASAFVVNAASVTWNVDIYDLAAEGKDTTGYSLYVFAGDAASTLVSALNNGGKFDQAAYDTAFASATKMSGTFDQDGWAEGTLSGVGDTISLLILTDGTVADSTFYYQSGIDTTGYTFEPPAGSPGGLYLDFAGMSSGTVGTAAIPEPTSGLLMLIGLAGLALRRRRA